MSSQTDLKNVLTQINRMGDILCRQLLTENEDLMTTLQQLKFNIAVVDSIFFMKYQYLIPHRLGIPWVTYTDVIEPWLIRVPWFPSFLPMKTTRLSDRMTFLERLQNTAFTVVFALFPWVPEPPEDVVQPYRKFGSFESMNDLVSRSLLYIITDDIILDYPQPHMPNMIHAGGLTVKPGRPESLSNKFRTFMEESDKGVIIVSFGSMASNFPHAIESKFLDAFTRLSDYRFIWRFENKNKRKLPENVLIDSWLPQNDLLAHPKTKLFITHSGNNGQFESVYHGVPMIGFPMLGDQEFNAHRMVNKGYGIAMAIQDFTADQLEANIRQVLSDVSYKKRVTLASSIFKNALQTPGERAAYWIEHVIKFGGNHLKSAGNDLSLFAYFMLDVVLTFLVGISILLFCIYKLLRFILVRIIRKYSNTKQPEEKKTQ